MKSFNAILSIVILLVLCETLSQAQSVPSLINYQGRLTDSAGVPLPAGTYRVAFRLWDKQALAVGQQLVWGREYDVTIVEAGAFSVILGSGGQAVTNVPPPAVNDLAYAFGEPNRFLSLTITRNHNGQVVANPNEILPRQQILSVPFSLQAQVATSLTTNLANALCPPGSVMAYMGTTPPPGWLLCDGSPLSRSQYAALFAIIGTISGSGDGVTTFNLPDFRGRFLRGFDDDAGRDPDKESRMNSVGTIVGNKVGSYQLDAVQGHHHALYYRNPGGGFEAQGPGGSGILIRLPGLEVENTGGPTKAVKEATTDGTHGTPRVSSETRPQNAYVNYVIKY